MALSMTAVVSEIRDIIDEITEIKRVYAASETDREKRIPWAPGAAGLELPCVMVFPGADVGEGFQTYVGGATHEYLVSVQIFENVKEEGPANIMPLVDLIYAKFRENIKLGGASNAASITFAMMAEGSQGGMAPMPFAGVEYIGIELNIHVREEDSTLGAPEVGD